MKSLQYYRYDINTKEFKIIQEVRILKPYQRNGYLRVKLTKDRKEKTLSVHRLVAEAFIPNPENKPHINHIDGVKDHNKVENLEWCTRNENMQHAYRTGLKVVTEKQRECARIQAKLYFKHIGKPIIQYNLQGNILKEWNSITEAEKELNISHISCCCRGTRKTAGGYIWRYKEDT